MSKRSPQTLFACMHSFISKLNCYNKQILPTRYLFKHSIEHVSVRKKFTILTIIVSLTSKLHKS